MCGTVSIKCATTNDQISKGRNISRWADTLVGYNSRGKNVQQGRGNVTISSPPSRSWMCISLEDKGVTWQRQADQQLRRPGRRVHLDHCWVWVGLPLQGFLCDLVLSAAVWRLWDLWQTGSSGKSLRQWSPILGTNWHGSPETSINPQFVPSTSCLTTRALPLAPAVAIHLHEACTESSRCQHHVTTTQN